MRVAFCFFLLLCVLLLTGCSGDLGAPTGLLTRAVTFSVEWGSLSGKSARSSKDTPAFIAPSQAKSAVLSLLDATSGTILFSRPVNRSLDPSTINQIYTQNYTFNAQVRLGETILVVTCYLEPDAQGSKIGTLVNPNIDVSSPTVTIPVSTVQTAATVTVAAGQSIPVGGHLTIVSPADPNDPNNKQLSFTPLDKNGNAVIVSPDAVVVNVNTGTQYAQVVDNTTLIGFTSGKPTISVTINNPDNTSVTSDPVSITVVSNVRVTINPTQLTLNVKVDTHQFTATVTNANNSPVANAKVYWSVLEGAAGGTIDANGLYTAPAAPGVFHVIATSQADTGQSATATVTVQGGSGNVNIQ